MPNSSIHWAPLLSLYCARPSQRGCHSVYAHTPVPHRVQCYDLPFTYEKTWHRQVALPAGVPQPVRSSIRIRIWLHTCVFNHSLSGTFSTLWGLFSCLSLSLSLSHSFFFLASSWSLKNNPWPFSHILFFSMHFHTHYLIWRKKGRNYFSHITGEETETEGQVVGLWSHIVWAGRAGEREIGSWLRPFL